MLDAERGWVPGVFIAPRFCSKCSSSTGLDAAVVGDATALLSARNCRFSRLLTISASMASPLYQSVQLHRAYNPQQSASLLGWGWGCRGGGGRQGKEAKDFIPNMRSMIRATVQLVGRLFCSRCSLMAQHLLVKGPQALQNVMKTTAFHFDFGVGKSPTLQGVKWDVERLLFPPVPAVSQGWLQSQGLNGQVDGSPRYVIRIISEMVGDLVAAGEHIAQQRLYAEYLANIQGSKISLIGGCKPAGNVKNANEWWQVFLNLGFLSMHYTGGFA